MSEYIKISDIPFRDLAEGHNTDIKVLVAFASDIKNLPTIEVSEDCISREEVIAEFERRKDKLYEDDYFDELMWIIENI